MPYRSINELPVGVRGVLPEAAQRVWREVFNDTAERTGNEGSAIAAAWKAIRNGWRKTEAGDWVRKQDEASTPAPVKDQIRGSTRNEPGSAAGARNRIEISNVTERALQNKVREHNEKYGEDSKRTSLGTLKAVYRRGAGAYSTSHRPGMTRNQWAMGRVNAFLTLLRTGKPDNPKYTSDNDLLPDVHVRSAKQVEKAESFKPPEDVQRAAARGLELRRKFNRGGTEIGVARARDLSNGKNISADTIKRMVSFFARHAVDAQAEGWGDNSNPSAGWVAHLLWGGNPGKRWANSVAGRLEKGDDLEEHWEVQFDITKTDEQQLVFGWLSVSKDTEGRLIIDKQGDIIEPEELEKMAYDFVLYARKAGDMHKRTDGIGRLVESMVFTAEKQALLGIAEGTLPVGWFVGFKVDDAETWQKIRSGEYSAFSIGGSGRREEVDVGAN